MDMQHDSEQRVFLKIQDEMRRMRLCREKLLKKLHTSRKLHGTVPGVPLQMTLAAVEEMSTHICYKHCE